MTFLSLILHLFQADDLEGYHLLGAIAIFLNTFPNLSGLRGEFSGFTWEFWWAHSLQVSESSHRQQTTLWTIPGNTLIPPGMPWMEVAWSAQMVESTEVERCSYIVGPTSKTHCLQYIFVLTINPGL